jgi:hypothetical protein
VKTEDLVKKNPRLLLDYYEDLIKVIKVTISGFFIVYSVWRLSVNKML